jgi:hypothetical protein
MMARLMGESVAARARLAGRRRRVCAAMLGALCLWLLAAAGAQAATAPENTALPVVSGTRGEGDTLTASTGTWSGTAPITYAYQWERCNSQGACTEIPGATGSSYIEVSGDTGKLVLVTVTASNEGGSAAATSAGMPAISWGQNDHGQLGAIYKDAYEETPIDVEGLTTIKAFSAARKLQPRVAQQRHGGLLRRGTPKASSATTATKRTGNGEPVTRWSKG